MRFGAVPIAEALGAIVAHGVHAGPVFLKKGETVTAAHVGLLASVGVSDLIVARLEADDIGENEAARRIAAVVGGAHLTADIAFTGRANLFAREAGVLHVDVEGVDGLNAVGEALTLATLPPFRSVSAGEMVATVKVIPFAVPGSIVERALAAASVPIVDIWPFKPLRVAVVSTLMPGLKTSVIAKTMGHLADRLSVADAPIVIDERIPHEVSALAETLRNVADRCDLVVVFGASAITDRRDVVPAALVEAGGAIEHFGMPVDPGNLLLLGRMRGKPVIGAPGCARSPKENGFDWVLQRLLAGLRVTGDDVRRLGAGGLLMEIVSRPQPRAGEKRSGSDASVPRGLVGREPVE